ncbi:M20 family metallo-hydrolase [Candidatus Bathyarchaeota archaeon A05DMB-2]|nr:M20 family metallo-hydrolase [Candidatus Bathyarchaeota archaeon A05DMB-2]
MQNQRLFHEIEQLQTEMVETLMTLIRLPAIGPENGGDGENQKAEKLTQILQDAGFDRIERYDVEDSRISSGKRPNIITYCRGETDAKRLWIVTHLDVVPPGEEHMWTISKPFEPQLKGNRVYGRGAEDNGQSLVASLFAVEAIKRLGLKPKRTVALAFVADEEQGSTRGIQHLIGKGLFKKDDLIVVPDGGSSDGSFIEVAEKSVLWFKICTFGKQAHASLSNTGLNAHRVGMQVALALDRMLHKKYPLKDKRFDVPWSTFEPTKKEKNVDAVNIIPGEDTIYFDCRILPSYDVDEVLSEITQVTAEFEKETGAKIALDVLQKQAAPKTEDSKSEITLLLKKALQEARGLDARVGGIGGGTCATFFRKAGFPAVVWSTVDEVAHKPNEYSKVENMVNDAKVFALLATS